MLFMVAHWYSVTVELCFWRTKYEYNSAYMQLSEALVWLLQLLIHQWACKANTKLSCEKIYKHEQMQDNYTIFGKNESLSLWMNEKLNEKLVYIIIWAI